MTDRHQARILAMQALCQLEVLGDEFLGELDEFLADQKVENGVKTYAHELVHEAHRRLEEVDRAIQEVAEHWELSRMATVDRCTLRVAVCELQHRPRVPPRVVINEAIEIGKAFGTAESGAFINGILDAIVKGKDEA
jgi:N utilization substance protein B